MPLTNLAVLLMWLGIFLLTGIYQLIKAVAQFHQRVSASWQDIAFLLEKRAECIIALRKEARALSSLGLSLEGLNAAFREWEATEDPERRIAASQEFSRQIAILAAKAESLPLDRQEETRSACNLINELQEQEALLHPAREEYNAIATAWNTYRDSLPARLIAEAFSWRIFPLFYASDQTGPENT